MHIPSTWRLLAIAAAIAALTAACGGGGGDAAPVTPDEGQAPAATPTDTGNAIDISTDTTTDTSDSGIGSGTPEPVSLDIRSVGGGAADTPLKAGQSNTVEIALLGEDGQPLPGERQVRAELAAAVFSTPQDAAQQQQGDNQQDDPEKALFEGGVTFVDITLSNGTGQIVIIPEAGETEITVLLTDLVSHTDFTRTFTVVSGEGESDTTNSGTGSNANDNAGVCSVFGCIGGNSASGGIGGDAGDDTGNANTDTTDTGTGTGGNNASGGNDNAGVCSVFGCVSGGGSTTGRGSNASGGGSGTSSNTGSTSTSDSDADPCDNVGSPGAMSGAHIPTQSEKCAILKRHNTERALANVPELSWSTEAADSAFAWAQKLARSELQYNCDPERRPASSDYRSDRYDGGGEAIAKFTVINTAMVKTVVHGVSDFISEKQFYDNATGACNPPQDAESKVCTRYTQAVWSTTTTVGCAYAVATCDGKAGDTYNKRTSAIFVCHYNPRGNITGQRPY